MAKKEAMTLIKKAIELLKQADNKPIKERLDLLEKSLALLNEAVAKLD